MENDLRLRITEYFNLSIKDREDLIEDLVEFYFEKNVSIKNQNEFEISINQLLFSLELEHRFAIKSEAYNRAEIYQKLSRIFWEIKEEYYNQTDDNAL